MDNTGYLKYNGDIIEYKINRGKRKRLYLHVENGELEVRVPSRLSNLEIEKVVNEKARWIYNALRKYPKIEKVTLNYDTGDIFYILGNKYTLKINLSESNENYIHKSEETKELNAYLKKAYFNDIEKRKLRVEKLVNEYYSRLADEEISFSMEKMINKTNLVPSSFKVRNFKRAWGNCSSKKLISINWELIKYSRHAIDYVCLHELCHLKYMNHSKNFWNLVSYNMPDYKFAEKELKEKRNIYK